MNGELTKVTILAYDDERMDRSFVGKFELPINPENYSRNLTVELEDSQAQGSSGTNSKSDKTKPEEIKLDFFFDNTNTVQFNKLNGTPVSKQIEDFLHVAFNHDGKIHQPRFLKLCWEKLVFKCKLKDLAINYTLFAASGEPLRAKLSGTFQGFMEPELRVLLEDKQSPDLTHIRRPSENERLDLMTFDIYGADKHYLKIADVNGLTSPRLLNTDAQLIFPPIAKTT